MKEKKMMGVFWVGERVVTCDVVKLPVGMTEGWSKNNLHKIWWEKRVRNRGFEQEAWTDQYSISFNLNVHFFFNIFDRNFEIRNGHLLMEVKLSNCLLYVKTFWSLLMLTFNLSSGHLAWGSLIYFVGLTLNKWLAHETISYISCFTTEICQKWKKDLYENFCLQVCVINEIFGTKTSMCH